MTGFEPRTEERQASNADDLLPNGPAAAAILAAGAGSFALGILSVIADSFHPVARWLTFYRPTGPLSGVSTTAILLWLAVWLILARLWRSKSVALAKVNAAAFLLLALAVLLTFPPFAALL